MGQARCGNDTTCHNQAGRPMPKRGCRAVDRRGLGQSLPGDSSQSQVGVSQLCKMHDVLGEVSANCNGTFFLTGLLKNPACSQVTPPQLFANTIRHMAPPLLRSAWIVFNRQIMTMNIKPLGDRILVEAVEEKEANKGGIIIPDIAKEKPMESRVVALGSGKTDDNGKKVPFEMKKGDRLLVARYGGTEVKLQGKDYRILNSEDVLALLE
jgi:chaperonin GroES